MGTRKQACSYCLTYQVCSACWGGHKAAACEDRGVCVCVSRKFNSSAIQRPGPLRLEPELMEAKVTLLRRLCVPPAGEGSVGCLWVRTQVPEEHEAGYWAQVQGSAPARMTVTGQVT